MSVLESDIKICTSPKLKHIGRLKSMPKTPLAKNLLTIYEACNESKGTEESRLNTELGTLQWKPTRLSPKKDNSTIVVIPAQVKKHLEKQRSIPRRHLVILPQKNSIELRGFKM